MIIHKKDYDNKYLCNKAVKPTKNKLSWSWKRVNCLNCLRKKPTLSRTYLYQTL